MIQFPNCKINLGLSIIEKRSDGYHSLETVFYPVALQDNLEILPLSSKLDQAKLVMDAPHVLFTSSGIPIPGEASNNLCIKAYDLLKKDFPTLPPIQMHLHKNIPMGAGLGGGSSDGTKAIEIIDSLLNLQLSLAQKINYAAQLGSDCPFFVINQPCHATGRGEILTPINCDLSKYKIILIHPGIHVSTAWAFSSLTPQKKSSSIAEIIQLPITAWKNNLVNDFEAPVFEAHPLLNAIKQNLYQQGALYASMSGSGSTLFGIFPQEINYQLPNEFGKLRVDLV